jgi:hypothetical protein
MQHRNYLKIYMMALQRLIPMGQICFSYLSMKELSIRLRIGKKLLYNHDKSTAYKAVFSINGPNDLKTPIKIKSRDQPITICTLLKSLVMITNPLWRESFVVSLTRVSNSTYLRTQLMVYGLAGYYAIKEEKPSPIDNLQNRK